MVFYSILLADLLYHVLNNIPVRRQQVPTEAPLMDHQHDNSTDYSRDEGFSLSDVEKHARFGTEPPLLIKNTRTMIATLVFTTTLLFVRSIYRTIEVRALPLGSFHAVLHSI